MFILNLSGLERFVLEYHQEGSKLKFGIGKDVLLGLLSSFNRAPEVPRAQTAAPGNSTARVSRVNVGIRSDLHDQVRLAAFEGRTSVQAVVEQALEEYFKSH